MAVWRTNIGSYANQEIHHIVMAAADGIVKGGDAFIIGLAGVVHLLNGPLHCLKFSDQRSVQQQDKRAEPSSSPSTFELPIGPPQNGMVASVVVGNR